MKKFLICVLALMLSIFTFAACDIQKQEGVGDIIPQETVLDAAKEYIFSQYRDGIPANTMSGYTVTGVVTIKGTRLNVEWSVDQTDYVTLTKSEDGLTVNVGITQSSEADVTYTLTATIADAEGNTVQTSFTRNIPQWKENTYEQYFEAAAGDPVIVKGVVTGLIAKSLGASYNCIYFEDADGAYYACGGAQDPITEQNLAVGMEIRVTGTKDIYSGTHEIKDYSVEILNAEPALVEPADYTELFKNAEKLTDEALVAKQSALVTIKGVTISDQDASNGYYNFTLGGKKSYVRISSSTCPLTADEKKAFIAGHTEHFGWTADVTGVISIFSGAFYLTPVTVDAFVYTGLPELGDADAVAFVKNSLVIPAKVADATAIEVPAADKTYDKVKMAWALDKDYDFATIADGVLNIALPEEATTIVLTVTLTCGEITDTASYEIAVSANRIDWRSATFAVELANTLDGASKEMTEEYYYFFGQVADLPTEDYCNFNLSDGTNSILVYGLYAPNGEDRYGTKRQIAEIPFAQGDYVFLRSKVQNYKGTLELAQAQLISVGLDAAKAIELCSALDGAAMEVSAEEYYIFGQVADVPTDDYCNFNFTDGTNNIVVYGLYAKNEVDRYGTKRQIAEIPFTQGDWVLLKGKLQNYKGKLEVVYASLQSIGYSATSAATMAAALDGDAKETSENAYYFYGTVGEIYNTQYCNFYLTDATTSNVVVYGLYAPNGEDRYGSNRQIAEIPFKQGDSIIMYANVQNYKGTPELVNAVLVSYIPGVKGEEPVETPEPAVKDATVAELIAIEASAEMTQAYTVTGTVKQWGNNLATPAEAATQYGNFVLADAEGNAIVVYGATATEAALEWNATSAKYTYANAKDFLTNELTASIAVGSKVTLKVVRTSYNSNPQLNAIVLKVEAGDVVDPEPPVVEPEEPTAEVTVSSAINAKSGALNGKSISWAIDEKVTLINNQDASSTAIRTSDTDHFRAYAKSQLVINVAGGKLVKIVITCISNDYATVMATSSGGTASGSVVTITCADASEVKFSMTAQSRLNKIEVTYVPSTGECAEHAYDNACDANCNNCGAEREVPAHFDGNGDYFCDNCNAGMEMPEPEVKAATITELSAIATADEMTQAYTVTGTVKQWGNNLATPAEAATQYGNFVLADAEGNAIVVYGATATEAALEWNATSAKYTYANAKDFLTNELTASIAVGSKVTLKVVRTSYNSNPQLNAIVLKVEAGDVVDPEPPVVEPEEPAAEATVSATITANTGALNGKSISWAIDEKVTLTNNQDQSTSAIRTSDTDHFRAYAKSQLVISVNGGKLVKVVITCTSSSYATVMATSSGGTASGSVVTIECSDVSEIAFNMTAQSRFNKIEVTYAA